MKWVLLGTGFIWIGIALSFQSETNALICIAASVVCFTGAAVLFELRGPAPVPPLHVHYRAGESVVSEIRETRRAIQQRAMTKGRA